MKIFWKYKLYGNKNNHQLYMINENQGCKTVYFTKIIETIFIYCFVHSDEHFA